MILYAARTFLHTNAWRQDGLLLRAKDSRKFVIKQIDEVMRNKKDFETKPFNNIILQ